LPVVEGEYSVVDDHAENSETHENHSAEHAPEQDLSGKGLVRTMAPYVLVFVLGIFLYYFYFTNVSFNGVFKTATKVVKPSSKVAKAMESAQKTKKADYDSWMNQFYFQVKDASITDPNGENCKCGLTNFEKYLLNLNPKVYDTRGNGTSDGMMILQGIDPARSGRRLAQDSGCKAYSFRGQPLY
jgi:hypothetical protein